MLCLSMLFCSKSPHLFSQSDVSITWSLPSWLRPQEFDRAQHEALLRSASVWLGPCIFTYCDRKHYFYSQLCRNDCCWAPTVRSTWTSNVHSKPRRNSAGLGRSCCSHCCLQRTFTLTTKQTTWTCPFAAALPQCARFREQVSSSYWHPRPRTRCIFDSAYVVVSRAVLPCV